MKERNFYFDGNKVVLNVLEYRRNPKTLVSYFVIQNINTKRVRYVIEIACNAKYVSADYWWHNAKDLDTIKIKSFSV